MAAKQHQDPPKMDWPRNATPHKRYENWKGVCLHVYLRAHFKKDEEERAVYCLMNTLDNGDLCKNPSSMNLIQMWTKEKKMDNVTQ